MSQGSSVTNKPTWVIRLGGESVMIDAGTTLDVFAEDGVFGTVQVTSGLSKGAGGSVHVTDYVHPLTPFP